MESAAWLSNVLTGSNLYKRNQSDKKGRAIFSVKKNLKIEISDKPDRLSF